MVSRAAVRGGPVLRRPDARRDRRPRRALAGARGRAADRRRRALGAVRPRDARPPRPRRTARCGSARSARSGPRPRSSVRRRCSFLAPAPARRALARRRRAPRLATATRRRRRRRTATRCDGDASHVRAAVPAGTAFLESDIAGDVGHRGLREARWRRCAGDEHVLADVGYYEPWWIQIVKALVIFAVVLSSCRRAARRAQAARPLPGPLRPQPRRARSALLQPLADIIKLLTKEHFRPRTSIGWLFALAPIDLDPHRGRGVRDHPVRRHVRTSSARRSGSTASTSRSARSTSSRSARSPSTGSCSAAGRRARSTRSSARCARAAQLISYEVSQGLALVGVVMTAQSLSLTGIVDAQAGMWYIVPQFVGFLIFLVAAFAETNRAPFDLVEADAELVGGYNTEYGGARFAVVLLRRVPQRARRLGHRHDGLPRRLAAALGIDPPGWVDPFVVLGEDVRSSSSSSSGYARRCRGCATTS